MSALIMSRIQRRPTLAEQVYEAICDSILNGELNSGERLVVEQLASQLGVSQTPVREAVVHLVQDGLATLSHDGKLQVVPLTSQYVNEIFLVRSVLEGLAAEIVTSRLPDGELVSLRSLLEAGSTAIGAEDVGGYGTAGTEFHQRIVEAAANHTLNRELRSIRTHFQRIRNFSQRRYGEHLLHAQEEHWEVFHAIRKRDAVAAKLAMEDHIRSSGARIAELIEQEAEANKVAVQPLDVLE